MRMRLFLLFLLALPLTAQTADSNKVVIESLQDSIAALNTQLEDLESSTVDIQKNPNQPAVWLTWFVGILLGLASVSVIGSIFYGIVSTLRVQKDLKEVKELKKSAETDVENIKKKKEEIAKDKTHIDYISLGLSLSNQGRFLEALGVFERALKLDPQNTTALFQKGYCFTQLGNYRDAIEVYTSVIKASPDLVAAYGNRGNAFESLGEHKKALQDYEKVIELNPNDFRGHHNKGIALMYMERFDEAIDSFEKSIVLKPNNPESYLRKGIALTKKELYHEAIDSFKKVREISPTYIEPYYNTGFVLNKLRHYREAIPYLDIALSFNPNLVDAYDQKSFALLSYGSELLEKGKHREAMNMFEEARKSAERFVILSNEKNGYGNLSCALTRLKRYNTAIESLKKAKESGELELSMSKGWNPWEDEDLKPLQRGEYSKKFIEIVGPEPEKESGKAKKK